MINTLIGISKYILPLLPSFWVAVSLISLVYPQYARYKQDVQIKEQACLIAKRMIKKIQKVKIQDFILNEASGKQEKLLQAITHYTLQKQRLHRLKESITHLAIIDSKQVAKAIEEIERSNHIELSIEQRLQNVYLAQLKNPVYLEDIDIFFLLHLLNEPSIEVKRLTFQKEEKIDGEIFLLSQLEIIIYEAKS